MNIDKVLKLFKKANENDIQPLVAFFEQHEDFSTAIESVLEAMTESLKTFPVEDEDSAKIKELLVKQAEIIENSLSGAMDQLLDIKKEIYNIAISDYNNEI